MTSAPRGALRRSLDAFYAGCDFLAGIALVGIGVCVVIQIVARLLGLVLPWTTEVAGYMMAATSFLALAGTLNSGGHIRVDLLLGRLRGRARRAAELACLVLGSAIIVYFAWHVLFMTWQSYEINDVGQGVVAIPLWIPQSFMALGTLALAVLLLDNLIRFALTNTTSYPRDAAQPMAVE